MPHQRQPISICQAVMCKRLSPLTPFCDVLMAGMAANVLSSAFCRYMGLFNTINQFTHACNAAPVRLTPNDTSTASQSYLYFSSSAEVHCHSNLSSCHDHTQTSTQACPAIQDPIPPHWCTSLFHEPHWMHPHHSVSHALLRRYTAIGSTRTTRCHLHHCSIPTCK